MCVRRLIVEVETEGLNVTRFCAEHRVSTWFFWDLRRRYALEGDAALEPKSRAPHRVANKTPPEIEDTIIAKRKELFETGMDCGPDSIAFALRDLEGVPSASTIWRILKAHGFIVAQPSKAPQRTGRRFSAARANECWQLDDTCWELADGAPAKILNVVDDHSRLLVASVALRTCTAAASFSVLADAATVLGWPTRILTDNAPAFRDTLTDALAALGVGAGHSRPYHPQTNGKVERFHQTLKQWLTRQPPAATLTTLQDELDHFRCLYNNRRPHRALDRRFPADVWTTAPKSGPTNQPLGARTTIYRGVVNNGRFSITRHVITVLAIHNHKTALAVVTGTNCHVFIDGQLVRALTLDPTRRLQPIYDRPGARPQHERMSDAPRHP
jgi:transposase InsO family protein